MAVSNILGGKSRALITAKPSDSVAEVARKLSANRIGAVVVVDESGAILGIISERDIVRLMAEQGGGALTSKAGDLMTRQVRTCKVGDSEAELMALMTQHRIRHLPVVEAGKPVGMISIGDVVKFRIEAIEREAEDMKSYIATAG
jgi:CBS domain-containing protein